MIDLKNLSEEELRNLKEDIAVEIQNKVKEKVEKMSKEKGTLAALRHGDKIFGIRLSAGPHRAVKLFEKIFNFIGIASIIICLATMIFAWWILKL